MKKLIIDKFINNVHQERITVPPFVVEILSILLPERGKQSLIERGFDLQEIITAGQNKQTFRTHMDVIEHDVFKKIVVSIEHDQSISIPVV